MGAPPAPPQRMGTACPAVHLRPGGNERPPQTLAFFHAQDPHHAHRCSFPRARPASFRNSSWRNSMVAAPAAGPPPPIPPPAGPGGRVRVPGVRPGPAGPAAPLGGKEAASAGFLGAVTGLSVGGGVGRDEAPPTLLYPAPCILVPPTFHCHSSRFSPHPRPSLWVLNPLVWVASLPDQSLPGGTSPSLIPHQLLSQILSPPEFFPETCSRRLFPLISCSHFHLPLNILQRFVLPVLPRRISGSPSSSSCPGTPSPTRHILSFNFLIQKVLFSFREFLPLSWIPTPISTHPLSPLVLPHPPVSIFPLLDSMPLQFYFPSWPTTPSSSFISDFLPSGFISSELHSRYPHCWSLFPR